MDAPLIEFRNVSRIYGEGEAEVRALDGVSLTIAEGEFVAIMGPSGSGKSTAMNIIGCLDRPSAGDYLFNGVEVGQVSQDARALLRRHYLGFVFQGFNLLSRTSALENVELPMIYKGLPRAERLVRARAALEKVGLAGRDDEIKITACPARCNWPFADTQSSGAVRGTIQKQAAIACGALGCMTMAAIHL